MYKLKSFFVYYEQKNYKVISIVYVYTSVCERERARVGINLPAGHF